MSLPMYSKYKDSGVEWLGKVPEHWAVTALKRGFNVTLGKMLQPESSSPDDELLPYLRAANIQWGGVDTTDIKQMWLSKRDRSQLSLERGDLLVSEGGDVGRSCLWKAELDDCYFQNSVNRVRAHDGHSNRYLYYWMSTIKDKGYIDVLCNKSTIAHFTAEKVAAVPVPLPTSSEQAQIAAFLDRETARIDRLIATQRRLVELLKEKRSALISHTVTKGLNPNAPMKDSGVDWLGKVPEHWAVTALKRGFNVTLGKMLQPESSSPDDELLPYLRAANIQWGGVDTTDIKQMWLSKRDRSQLSLERGDLLVSEGGDVGRSCLWKAELDDCYFQNSVNRVRAHDGHSNRYLYYWMSTIKDKGYIDVLCNKSTIAHFTAEKVAAVPVPLPTSSEQAQIAAFLDRETAHIDRLIAATDKSIALAQERRSALISAAVTGKIDVRDRAIHERI
jgi:type I restriction enzyme S subunit